MQKTSAELSSAEKEQHFNIEMVEFRISILFQYFMYILAKLNTFSRSWKPIPQFNTFSIPRGNPVCGSLRDEGRVGRPLVDLAANHRHNRADIGVIHEK